MKTARLTAMLLLTLAGASLLYALVKLVIWAGALLHPALAAWIASGNVMVTLAGLVVAWLGIRFFFGWLERSSVPRETTGSFPELWDAIPQLGQDTVKLAQWSHATLQLPDVRSYLDKSTPSASAIEQEIKSGRREFICGAYLTLRTALVALGIAIDQADAADAVQKGAPTEGRNDEEDRENGGPAKR